MTTKLSELQKKREYFNSEKIMKRSILGIQVKRLLHSFLLTAFFSQAAFAHEFWIEPKQYQLESGAMIEASLRNGEFFVGSTVSFYKGSTNRFELVSHGQTEKIEPRLWDDPALVQTAQRSGLHVVVHQHPVATLTYTKWEKFQRFADHKDFKNILARHKARNLSENHFVEAYSRHSKSLIAVGDGAGSDRQTGLEIELVASQNPYTDNVDEGIEVVGYYQGKVRPNAQIELFEKAPNGEVEINLYRTDEHGAVLLPVKSKHSYLVDMVVLREPAELLTKEKRAVWESLWASLTFEVK